MTPRPEATRFVRNQAVRLQVGYFVLTRSDHTVSKLIRVGQALRYRWMSKPRGRLTPSQRRATHWNHAALVLDSKGRIAEALGSGVVERNLSKYTDDYIAVPFWVNPIDREQIVAFAESVMAARWRYGYATIASLALVVTGSRLAFERPGTAICSGFVAEALTRAGVIFPERPYRMMPADLYTWAEAAGLIRPSKPGD